jgi:hypothetical protein
MAVELSDTHRPRRFRWGPADLEDTPHERDLAVVRVEQCYTRPICIRPRLDARRQDKGLRRILILRCWALVVRVIGQLVFERDAQRPEELGEGHAECPEVRCARVVRARAEEELGGTIRALWSLARASRCVSRRAVPGRDLRVERVRGLRPHVGVGTGGEQVVRNAKVRKFRAAGRSKQDVGRFDVAVGDPLRGGMQERDCGDELEGKRLRDSRKVFWRGWIRC